MPAPKGNSNRTKHARYATVLGTMPKDAKHVEVRGNAYRRHLEQAVASDGHTLTLAEAAAIQSAVRHEQRAMLMTRYLRTEEIPLADRMGLLKEIGLATDARDKCLRTLGLHTNPAENPSASALPDLSDFVPEGGDNGQ